MQVRRLVGQVQERSKWVMSVCSFVLLEEAPEGGDVHCNSQEGIDETRVPKIGKSMSSLISFYTQRYTFHSQYPLLMSMQVKL